MKHFLWLLLLIASFTAAQAKVDQPLITWVDDDGVEAKKYNVGPHYTIITDAIRATAQGGTVYVLPGLYKNQLINIPKSLSLIAMIDNKRQVNQANNPNNTDWPVAIEGLGNGIQSFGGAENVLIRGFHIRSAKGNGIHIQGTGVTTYTGAIKKNGKPEREMFKITSLCQHFRIMGNFIENTNMDGIKVNVCNDVKIIGNKIRGTSLTKTGMEQAIDFMLSGNVRVARNLILDNAIGLVVKGGSVAATIVNNDFRGPFKWMAISGEPYGDMGPYSAESSAEPYTAKGLLVRNNTIGGSLSNLGVRGCQDCSYINNIVSGRGLQIVVDELSVSKNICMVNSGPVFRNDLNLPVKTSFCDANIKAAQIVENTPGGIDIAPNKSTVQPKNLKLVVNEQD